MGVDLRSFLDFLRENHSEQLWQIDTPVNIHYDITAYAMELGRQNRYPALYFTSVEGFDQPVLANLFADRRRIALAIGLQTENELINGWNQKAVGLTPPALSDEAPVKENILSGEQINIWNYPIPKHFEIDKGRYVTAGVIRAKDPDTGIGNLSYARMQIKDANTFGVSLHSRGDLWDFQRRAEARNLPLQAVVLIGLHPAISLAAATRMPLGMDELDLAGALMGAAVPVVPAETADLMVPAHAEMIMEGEFLPLERTDEGPFGEYTGYASARSTRNVFKVHTITHRQAPIYQTVIPGASPDHLNLSKASRVANLYQKLKQEMPNVVDLNYPMSGTHYHCYLSMKKTMEGQPKQAALLMFGLDHYLKLVIIVDDDIDVHDEQQVLWALATRFQADKGAFIVSGVACNYLDPSTEGGVGAKIGLDATQSMDSKIPRLAVSEEIMSRIRNEINALISNQY